MDLGEVPSTTNLLNQYNPPLHPKYVSLYPEVRKGNFSLQKLEIIIENHNQSKSRIVESSLNWSIFKTALTPKAIYFLLLKIFLSYDTFWSWFPLPYFQIIPTSSTIQIFCDWGGGFFLCLWFLCFFFVIVCFSFWLVCFHLRVCFLSLFLNPNLSECF